MRESLEVFGSLVVQDFGGFLADVFEDRLNPRHRVVNARRIVVEGGEPTSGHVVHDCVELSFRAVSEVNKADHTPWLGHVAEWMWFSHG